jgi:hypothetical protein
MGAGVREGQVLASKLRVAAAEYIPIALRQASSKAEVNDVLDNAPCVLDVPSEVESSWLPACSMVALRAS